MQIFKPNLLAIDAKEARRYAGLQKANFPEEKIQEACEEALLLAKPAAVWQVYPYDPLNHTVLAEEKFLCQGQSIQKHLTGAKKIIFLAATVGKEIEEASSRYFNAGNYAYAMLLDAAATTAVEQTADALENTLKPKFQAEGYNMRWRFSPGYGDWQIKNQTAVTRLALADKIGISLTDSLMLLPRKSITAVIPLIPAVNCLQAESVTKGCAGCNKIDCLSRQT